MIEIRHMQAAVAVERDVSAVFVFCEDDDLE